MRNPPAAGGGATNRLSARYEMFEIELSSLPWNGSVAVQSIDAASSLVESTKAIELTTATATDASTPQWVRTEGAARRSPLRSSGRMAPRKAAVIDGRGWGGVAGWVAWRGLLDGVASSGASKSG